MDFQEIQIYFDAYKDNKETELKEKASFCWRQAMLTASAVGSAFGDKKPPTLFEAFPELFEKEAEEEKWRNYQSQLLQYTKLWNEKRHKEEGTEDVSSGC